MSKALPAFIFGQKEIERNNKKNVDNDTDKESTSKHRSNSEHMG